MKEPVTVTSEERRILNNYGTIVKTVPPSEYDDFVDYIHYLGSLGFGTTLSHKVTVTNIGLNTYKVQVSL